MLHDVNWHVVIDDPSNEGEYWEINITLYPRHDDFQGKAKHSTFVTSTYELFGSWDSGLT
jgi:hypothetical protein